MAFSKGIRRQNPRRHGGKVMRATKGDVKTPLLGKIITIPKGCSMRIFKRFSGEPYKAVLLNKHGQVFKTFFEGKGKSSRSSSF